MTAVSPPAPSRVFNNPRRFSCSDSRVALKSEQRSRGGGRRATRSGWSELYNSPASIFSRSVGMVEFHLNERLGDKNAAERDQADEDNSKERVAAELVIQRSAQDDGDQCGRE